MPLAFPRFTIRSLMIAVAICAGILALYKLSDGLVLALAAWIGLLYIAEIRVLWWMFHGFRRLSALFVGITGALANVTCCLVCVYFLRLDFLMVLVSLVSLPVILGAGSAWAFKATRRNAIHRRSPCFAWPLVLGLAFAPLTMVYTLWPLRIAYRISRPALEHLADRVAAGQVFAQPEWAGMIYVVSSAVDPAKGNVGLIVDADATGRSGFVRIGPGIPPDQNDGPLYNRNLNEHLAGRWWYQSED